ncbi:MAG: hypothetical protein ACUVUF_07280 [Candidatus Bathycorpusculaceae bacterium]
MKDADTIEVDVARERSNVKPSNEEARNSLSKWKFTTKKVNLEYLQSYQRLVKP